MPVLPAVPSTMVPPGLERAALDRILDNEQRRAVLHRLAGVQELRLAQNLASRLFGGAAQADEGRVANRGKNRRLDRGAGVVNHGTVG